MTHCFPALLSIDYGNNTFRRYERFAPVGVKLTHMVHPPKDRVNLRTLNLTPIEAEALRVNFPSAFCISNPSGDSNVA